MTARKGAGPDNPYLVFFRDLFEAAPEVTQDDLADYLGCDRSRISAMLAGRQCLPFHEAVAICAFFEDWRPFDVALRRGGRKSVPVEQPGTAGQVERGICDAIAASGHASARLAEILRGGVEPHERPDVRAAVLAQIEVLEGLAAMCEPPGPRVVRGAS